MTEDRDMHTAADPDVVRAWVSGWALSRNVPPPSPVVGGFRIDVGLPAHLVRYVFHTSDAAFLRDVCPRIASPGTWLKVCAPLGAVAPLLTPEWSVSDPQFMMTIPLSRVQVNAPDGYSLQTTTQGQVTQVHVIAADGQVAARGKIARAGHAAVVDQVATDPAHRRRGLGSLVMDCLGDAAAAQGAVRGVLVATADGLALYRVLGWSLHSVVTPATIEL